jgi:hypothetical protein
VKWMAAVLLVIVVFVTGALYGIDKNNQKLNDQPVVVTAEQDQPSHREPEKRIKDDGTSTEAYCAPPEREEKVPWISKLAGGVGEGVATSFNGVIVVLSEIIQSGS